MGPRARIRYVVEQRKGRWALRAEGSEFGRYPTRDDAVRAAITDCAHICNLGHDVSILVRQPDGGLAEAWRYDSETAGRYGAGVYRDSL